MTLKVIFDYPKVVFCQISHLEVCTLQHGSCAISTRIYVRLAHDGGHLWHLMACLGYHSDRLTCLTVPSTDGRPRSIFPAHFDIRPGQ